MIAYGAGPASTEVEVVVFGPGYGEGLAVHLGDSQWMLVDSCIDPHNKQPASLNYLLSIGVPADHVRAIVATHWHDDHVRGLSTLVAHCPNAELQISGALNSNEARQLLAAYSSQAAPGLAVGTKEMCKSIQSSSGVFYVHSRSTIHSFVNSDGQQVTVTALSPTQAAVSKSLTHLAQYLPDPKGTSPISHITPAQPNSEAVVIHIDIGGDAILLGSDLEEHSLYGWTALASDALISLKPKASVYKVAHHGSKSGDSSLIWQTFLRPGPTAAMTPFSKGNVSLPTDDDLQRLKSTSHSLYLASRASRKPTMDANVSKKLAQTVKKLAPVNNGFGAIRMRRDRTSSAWRVECFGDAKRM